MRSGKRFRVPGEFKKRRLQGPLCSTYILMFAIDFVLIESGSHYILWLDLWRWPGCHCGKIHPTSESSAADAARDFTLKSRDWFQSCPQHIGDAQSSGFTCPFMQKNGSGNHAADRWLHGSRVVENRHVKRLNFRTADVCGIENNNPCGNSFR